MGECANAASTAFAQDTLCVSLKQAGAILSNYKRIARPDARTSREVRRTDKLRGG